MFSKFFARLVCARRMTATFMTVFATILTVTLTTMFTTAYTPTAFAAASNDELKIGISQEFENMNPMIMTMAASLYMGYLCNRSMVFITPYGKTQPQMVKSIPSLENKQAKFETIDGKKGMVATWELLDNLQWGDGVAITCDDLKFAWQLGLNENISVGSRDPYTDVKDITWDPKTPKKCVVTYKEAKWDFFRNQFAPMPKHIEEKINTQYGNKKEGYDQNSEYVKNPTNPGLYNGPYVISEIKLGDHVSFSANPKFYGPAPHIKKIIFKLIPNTGTLEANLRSGTIDMVGPIGFDFDQATAFEKKVKADKLPFQVLYKTGTNYEHIDMNIDNPLLSDVRVRKAMVMGINREEMMKALFQGKQTVAAHNVSPIDQWFTNDPKKVSIYKYDKAGANKLLDEAGWKMGADGVRTKDGKRLSLQFMTTAGNKTRETVQTFLQAEWKAVGVEVIIKNEPARVFFGDTMTKRKFDGLALFTWVSSPEQSPKTNLKSDQIPTEKNAWSGQNFTGYSNKTVDELLTKLDIEFSAAKRKQLAQDILKRYTEDLPVIPLFYRSDIATIPSGLKNYRLAGHQFYETNEAETWDFAK